MIQTLNSTKCINEKVKSFCFSSSFFIGYQKERGVSQTFKGKGENRPKTSMGSNKRKLKNAIFLKDNEETDEMSKEYNIK